MDMVQYILVSMVWVWHAIVCFEYNIVLVWYGIVLYGMVLYGMVLYGMVWYCMVWYCMVLCGTA